MRCSPALRWCTPSRGSRTVALESTRAVVAAGRAVASVGHRVPKLLPGLTLAPAALGSLWQLQHPHLPVTDCAQKACLHPEPFGDFKLLR